MPLTKQKKRSYSILTLGMFPNLASAISSEKVSFSKRFPNTDGRDKQIETEKTNLKIFIFDESLFTD